MINKSLEKNTLSFNESLNRAREELDRLLKTSPKVIRSKTEHLSKSRGKFIRAASLLASAEDGDGAIDGAAVGLAVSIELLHLAALVHDDVIDHAPVRRGLPTLHQEFGEKAAVICGDYLFCFALKTAYRVSCGRDYSGCDIPDYMSRVCLGELMENVNNRNFDLTGREYLKIISGKTAALFEAAFHAGAMLCEQAKEQANLYTRLGHYVGMIFQITDDCLDYESTEQAAKKPVSSDYQQGVVTLPLIFAFRQMPGLKQRVLSGGISKEEVKTAVNDAGGVAYARSVSKRYYEKAGAAIKKLNAHQSKKARLAEILDRAYYGLGGVNIG